MAYDPDRGLSEEDQAYLESIQNRWLQARLVKVGPRSVQGHLIGKLMADAEERGMAWNNLAAGGLPVTVQAARGPYRLTLADERAIEYSRAHAAAYITEMSDRMRERIRETIARAVEERASPGELGQVLFQQFGEANHDWRRIALTESNIAASNGYLASLVPGTLVVGDSADDACGWCRENLHSRAFTLLGEAPEPAEGTYYTQEQSHRQVWPGKTNVGRSQYPTDAAGRPRTVDELWHPTIPAHPHCRCRWRRFVEAVEEIVPGTNVVQQKAKLSF